MSCLLIQLRDLDSKSNIKFVPQSIIPRPIKDIVVGSLGLATILDPNNYFGGLLAGIVTGPLVERISAGAIRATIAAAGSYAASQLGGSMVSAAVVGGILSTPSTLIAGGSAAMYYGAGNTTNALATADTQESLTALGIGLGSMYVGWLLLENHDLAPYGLLEQNVVHPLQQKCSAAFAKALSEVASRRYY